MTVDDIRKQYDPRIRHFLGRVATAAKENGWAADEVEYWDDEEPEWHLLIRRASDHERAQQSLPGMAVAVLEDVDVKFCLCEAKNHDGCAEDEQREYGINFMLDMIELGGRILGQVCPYNYSEQVWVDRRQPRFVEERFRLVEKTDPLSVIACLEDSR